MKAYVVDSAAVRSNLQQLQTRAGSAVLWAVLKGDGYGLGLLPMAAICREGVDAIRGALRELEKEGYVIRRQLRGPGGQIQDIEYLIYEQPPGTGSPGTGNPGTVRPCPEKSAESNMDRSSTE